MDQVSSDTTTIVLLDSADRMFVYSIDRKDLSLKQRSCLVTVEMCLSFHLFFFMVECFSSNTRQPKKISIRYSHAQNRSENKHIMVHDRLRITR